MKREHIIKAYGEYLLRLSAKGEHWVDFEVFERIGRAQDGTPLYAERGSSIYEPITNPDCAEYFLRGSVKWDECSHIWYGNEEGYHHFCSREQALDVGKILAEVYDRATALMGELRGEEE